MFLLYSKKYITFACAFYVGCCLKNIRGDKRNVLWVEIERIESERVKRIRRKNEMYKDVTFALHRRNIRRGFEGHSRGVLMVAGMIGADMGCK